MQKIQKGDEVIVLTGKDKGRKGKVLSIDTLSSKAIVEGINVAKKHVRPNPELGEPGGILDREMPIHISNLAIFNSSANKADKVSINVDGEGNKTRVFRSTGEKIV